MIQTYYPGELVAIMGTMFSGKTNIMRIIRLCADGPKPDIFYPSEHATGKTVLRNHDDELIYGSIILDHPNDILGHIRVGQRVALIDEAALWKDAEALLNVIDRLKENGLCVVVSSFNTDANGDKPWVIQQIEQRAFLLVERRTKCGCGVPATFTEKVRGNDDPIEPTAEFQPKCQAHFRPLHARPALTHFSTFLDTAWSFVARYEHEAGLIHPSERELQQAFLADPRMSGQLLIEQMFGKKACYTRHADNMLSVLGHVEEVPLDIRLEVVQKALQVNPDDYTLHEAALNAIESWGDKELLALLENLGPYGDDHRELEQDRLGTIRVLKGGE